MSAQSVKPDAVTPTRQRRWFQFSLRTVLVVVTLLCIGPGGYVAYEQRKARKQKAAVEAIEKLGGEVRYDRTTPVRSGMLRQILGDESFGNVTEVLLANSQVTDVGLEHLAELTDLEILGLTDTQVTDGGLAHLAGLKNLDHLWLYDTQVTDAGIAELQKALPGCKIYW